MAPPSPAVKSAQSCSRADRETSGSYSPGCVSPGGVSEAISAGVHTIGNALKGATRESRSGLKAFVTILDQ